MFGPNVCLVQRIFYSPLQAAIRWANLLDDEGKILDNIGSDIRPTIKQLEKWPLVYLYCERIFDAIIHGELPCGKNGVRCKVEVDDPDLTVRHIDLRRWVIEFYPAEKPGFLFSSCERYISNGNDPRDRLHNSLNHQAVYMNDEHGHYKNYIVPDENKNDLRPRAEDSYLVILGGLCYLLFSQKLVDLTNQESLINILTTHFPDVPGMSQSTLRMKFAKANRTFSPYQKIFISSTSKM